MVSLTDVYAPLAIVGGLVSLLFVRPALNDREKPGATGLIVLAAAAVVYALATGVRSLGPSPAELFAVRGFLVLGGSLGAVGLFLVFGEYSGLVSPNRRVLYALFGFVLVFQVIVWTNQYHGRFFEPVSALNGGLEWGRRDLFWVYAALAYGLLLLGYGLMILDVIRSRGIRRRQGIYILAGSFPPIVAISVSVTWSIVPVDITPLGFVVATAVLSWGLFSADLFGIVSVGRSRAVEDMEGPFVTIDEEGRVIDTNPAARDVFGADEGWRGLQAEVFFGDLSDQVDLARKGGTGKTEVGVEHDGTQSHFDVETTPIRGPQDERRGQLVTFHDVTETRTRERRLRDLARRFDLALEATDAGVWELDPRTDTVTLDDRSKRLFGHGADETVETVERTFEYVHPDDESELAAAYEAGLGADVYETEFRILPEEGERRWLWLRAEPQQEEGRPVRFVGLVQNITERKKGEQKLRRKNELLDEFASVVSHDVATPLGVIRNKAQLIEMTGDTAHAGDIYDASERVQTLVDKLKHLAREGEDVGETHPVDLSAAAEEAWNGIETPDAELSIAESTVVDADRTRLKQLLENLFENAVEHGHEAVVPADGEVEKPPLSVTVGTVGDGFYVADDGRGIPEGDREEIFEQGYSTTEGGTGLGLAIVSRILDGHGWDIGVTDSRSGGARFEIHTDP